MKTRPTLRVIDGTVYANSLEMAEKFGKSHDAILKIIRRQIKAISFVEIDERDEFLASGFVLTTYTNKRGQSFPCYDLSHDAFDFVAFGLTGPEATAWQLAYILEFRRMERTERRNREKLKTLENLELFPDQLREKEYTVSEVLDEFIKLGIWQRRFGRGWVMRQIDEKSIEAHKPGNVWLIPESSLKKLVRKQEMLH